MHSIGLIGGTFDRFHAGHHALLLTGLEKCQKLEVWMTSDILAQAKNSQILSWDERAAELLDLIGKDLSPSLSLHLLEDNVGPAPTHLEAGAIICTSETRANCEEINLQRQHNGLGELEIIQAEHVDAHDGKPISSSRIRAGEIDSEGNPWIPKNSRQGVITLTKKIESKLKDPFGILCEGLEDDLSVAILGALEIAGDDASPIIGVGDVTILALQQVGRNADIGLIDEKTQREKWHGYNDINQSDFDNILNCINPPGQLTPSLLNACEIAMVNFHNEESTLIIVDGEEDLAPLFLHPLAPIGSVVLYGQPHRGVVLRLTGIDSKTRCRRLLTAFDSA